MKQQTKSQEVKYANPQGSDEEMLGVLQRETFAYFIKEVNDKTGLIADKTEPGVAGKYCSNGHGA